MILPDDNVLKALCHLESVAKAEFRILQQWFLDSAGEQDRILRTAESAPLIYRAQGASKELREFCTLAANPTEVVVEKAKAKAGVTPFTG